MDEFPSGRETAPRGSSCKFWPRDTQAGVVTSHREPEPTDIEQVRIHTNTRHAPARHGRVRVRPCVRSPLRHLATTALLLIVTLLALPAAAAAAFPTTGVIDTFNRANGGIPGSTSSSGATWASDSIDGNWSSNLVVSANQMKLSAAGTVNSYLTPSYGPDAEVYVDVPTLPPNGQYVALFARIQAPGGSSGDYYGLVYTHNTAGNATYTLRRYIDITWTDLITTSAPALAAGDGLGLEVTGTGATVTVRAMRRTAGLWGQVTTVGDSSASRIIAAGGIGVEVSATTTLLDNLGGGTARAWDPYFSDANAQVGATHPVNIKSTTPHFSFENRTGGTVDRQRVQVLTSPLDDVVGLWHFDTATGSTFDSTGNGRTLVFSGGATTAPGNTGFSEAFVGDGVNNKALVTDSAFDLASNTAEAWVKVNSLFHSASSHNFVVMKGPTATRTFGLGVAALSPADATQDGRAICSSSAGGVAQSDLRATARIDDGQWHYVACVWDSTTLTLKVYVDGVLSGTRVAPGQNSPSAGTALSVGAKFDGADPFDGQIDSVRISSVPRTAAEILSYYQLSKPHGAVLWDSDPTDTGIATASCGSFARCADVVYGSSGSAATPLDFDGSRYYVRAKYKAAAGSWSAWSPADWFQTAANVPSALFSHDTDASAGTTNNATIKLPSPHFSWLNNQGPSATKQRLQVLPSSMSNVLASWQFDTSPGPMADSSGNGLTLAPVGAPTSPAGKPNFDTSLGLNGTSQGAAITASSLDLANNFTVEAWAKMTGGPVGDQYIIEKGGSGTRGFTMYVNNTSGTLVGMVSRGGADIGAWGSTNIADGAWHHVTMTVSAANLLSIYVDGVLENTQAIGGPVNGGIGASMSIGQWGNGGGGGWFSGQIDDVRISSVARLPEELRAVYGSGREHGAPLWDSDPTDTGAAIAGCAQGARCQDVVYGSSGSTAAPLTFNASRYYVRAKYKTPAGVWSAWSGEDWFRTVADTAPNPPTAPAQFRNDGTTAIGSGAWTADGASNNVVLTISMKDADASQTLTPWVEVIPSAGSFGATACGQSIAGQTFSGTPVNAPTGGTAYTGVVNVTGLSGNTTYKWRACSVDQSGVASTWVNKGANPDFGVDVTAATQPASVADGTSTDVNTIASTTQLSANWPASTDTGGSGVASYDWCIATAASCAVTVSTGSVASPTVTFTKVGLALTPGTKYYVCVRSVDAVANQSGYRCSDGATVATVASTSPATAAQGRQDLAVTINGTGFVSGATVAFGGAGISLDSTTFVSATRIDVVIDITGAAATGARNVVVTNPDGIAITGSNLFTIAGPTITVSLDTLGYTDGARDNVAPNTVGFGSLLPSAVRDIGPAASGQTLAGAAAKVTVVSDTYTTLQAASTNWSNGVQTIPAGNLAWKHNGVAEAWTPFSTSAGSIESPATNGTQTYQYDYRLTVPAAQTSGTYTATVTYTALVTF